MKKIDRHGLHARDCSCAPCEAGFRPTLRQRQNAQLAWDRRAQREKAEAEQKKREEEGKASGAGRKRPTTEQRFAALEAETKRALEAIRPPERPATADELREMRQAFFPNLKRRGDRT